MVFFMKADLTPFTYFLFRDTDAAGMFLLQNGQADSGTTGLTITMPSDDIVFYLVAGANIPCGIGPKK